jgi:DNA processing protein
MERPMTDDVSLALTFLDTLPLVGLSDRLREDDPELLELAAPFVTVARDARLAARADGIDFVAWNGSGYPDALRQLPDMPPGLWYRGRLECLAQRPAVAIVGSRAGSPVAIETATHLGRGLAERGIAVVSGLARGVDSAAHRGALLGGGVTVGVLGSGLSRLYPAEHRELAAAIAKQGLVVSEYPPAMPALPFHFPLRNRIISGLSRAVVVIEAAEKSGSLITASCALEQGKEVMAVPGNVLSGRNRGGHALIRDGAAIVETVDDILEQLGWTDLGSPDVNDCQATASGDGLPGGLQPGVPYGLDEIAAMVRLEPTVLLARLTALELSGHVKRIDGGRFVRAVRTC